VIDEQLQSGVDRVAISQHRPLSADDLSRPELVFEVAAPELGGDGACGVSRCESD
jgi:hypothetical protein